MQSPEDIHRYLTEQIVGQTLPVEMGPADTVQVQAPGRPYVLWLEQRLRLAGMAAKSIFGEPASAAAGTPVNLGSLRRWRLGLVVLALSGWSAALVGATVWWMQSH